MKKYNWIFLFVLLFTVVGIQSVRAQESTVRSSIGSISTTETISSYIGNILSGNYQKAEYIKGLLDFNGDGTLNTSDVALAQQAESGLTTWAYLTAQRDNPLTSVIGQGATAKTLFDIVRGFSTVTLTDTQKKMLDFNGDGKLTSTDATVAYNAEKGTLTWISLINTRDSNRLQREIFSASTSIPMAIREFLINLRTLTPEQQKLLNFDGVGGLTVADRVIADRAEINLFRWKDLIRQRDNFNNPLPTTLSVKVVSPNGNESFIAGSPITVNWTSSGVPPDSVASISLIKEENGGVSGTPLAGSGFYGNAISIPMSDEVYTANIPANMQTGKYKVRVGCMDSVSRQYFCGQTGTTNLSVQDDSDGHITILGLANNTTITSPKNGDVFYPGQTMNISWSPISPGVASINLKPLDGSTAFNVYGDMVHGDSVNTSGSFAYKLPEVFNVCSSCFPLTNYQVEIKLADGKVVTSGVFSLQNKTTAPLNITFPSFGSILQKGLTYNITWTGSELGVTSYLVHLINGDGLGGSRFLGTAYISQGSFSWTVPSDVGTGYGAQIKFSGAAAIGDTSEPFTLADSLYFLSAPANGSSLKIGSTYEIRTTTPNGKDLVSWYLGDGSQKGGVSLGKLSCKNQAENNVYCLWEVGKYLDANGVTKTANPGSSYFIQADVNTTPAAIDAVTNGYFSLYNSNETPPVNPNSDIASLLKLIEELRKQIAALQGQVVTENSLPNETTSFSYNWQNALYVGMRNNEDVKALQNALLLEKVYTGPVTGNFGPLTLAGAKAFQEKYGITPVTGFVGEITINKLNSLYFKG